MNIIRAGGQEFFDILPPLAVDWKITERCNYRCSYCFFYGKGKKHPRQMPFSTLDQLKTAVDNIVSLNRPWYRFTLSGGEPTIHPHFFDLITMLHETFGERLNYITITSNGSRNNELYKKLFDISKEIFIKMQISIHTDHAEKDHILELIENLSNNINLHFFLMFNPAKRELAHEIYDALLEYRKKFPFTMDISLIRDGDRFDPRYKEEDFAWHKKALAQFKELVKTVNVKVPIWKKNRYPLPKIIRDIENNGKITTVNQNRSSDFAKGLLNYRGMYCLAYTSAIAINPLGRCGGMICGVAPRICNLFEKDAFIALRDNLIQAVPCYRNICGCSNNDGIPKFASEEEAKKYLEFAKKRQAELFDEYLDTRTFEKS